MSGRPWSRSSESYISATARPIDKRSSLMDNLSPPTKYVTNAEPSKWPLWHVAQNPYEKAVLWLSSLYLLAGEKLRESGSVQGSLVSFSGCLFIL